MNWPKMVKKNYSGQKWMEYYPRWELYQHYLWRANRSLWKLLYAHPAHGITFGGMPYGGISKHNGMSIKAFKAFVDEVERWAEAHPDGAESAAQGENQEPTA